MNSISCCFSDKNYFALPDNSRERQSDRDGKREIERNKEGKREREAERRKKTHMKT